MRDRSIDLGKGIVVLLMIYCHVMDFFGDKAGTPVINEVITAIGALAFPTFLFFFGRSVRLAYLNREYKTVFVKMVKTFLRMLAAFYISGIAYTVMVRSKNFDIDTVHEILTLNAIPGMSEFLVAFALYMLVVIVAFYPLKLLCKRPIFAVLPMAACVACCFIPYDRVPSPQLALLIGGVGQCYFPIVQYMPYFLMGIIFTSLTERVRWGVGGAAVVLSAVAYLCEGGWPSRFPPAWNWICLSAGGVAVVQLVAWALLKVNVRPIQWLYRRVENVGAGSLTYLLFSNLFIFAIAGKKAIPRASIYRNHWFWSTPIQKPLGSFYWTCILVAVIAFCIYLCKRSGSSSKPKQ